MSRLFSAYVIVDWSAAAKPSTGADSVWIGVVKRDVRFRLTYEAHNPPTRAEAEKKLVALLDDFKKRSERALVGFDFPLGFPRGFAKALNLPGEAPWRAVCRSAALSRARMVRAVGRTLSYQLANSIRRRSLSRAAWRTCSRVRLADWISFQYWPVARVRLDIPCMSAP